MDLPPHLNIFFKITIILMNALSNQPPEFGWLQKCLLRVILKIMNWNNLPLKKIILFFLTLLLIAMIALYPCYVRYLEEVVAELPLNMIYELCGEFLKKILLPLGAVLSLTIGCWFFIKKVLCKKK